MDILYYNGANEVEINPHFHSIKQFKDILDLDERWLSYIYLFVRHDSPYIGYDDEDKQKMILEDLFENENEEIPEAVLLARLKYESLYENALVRLLKSALSAVEQMTQYFNDIDFGKTDNRGSLLYNPKDVMAVISKLGSTVDNIIKLREQVEKDLGDITEIRGGVEVTKWNQ